MNKRIFSKLFLAKHLQGFRLSNQTDINRKKDIIDSWINIIETRRLKCSKEEEIKSRFILEIFGDLLGFNYKNPSNWLIREELKTNLDATKPDAALGRFKINETGIENDVHVIIEIKDAKTSLDIPQNRKAFKLSPVDQAFLYASKVGGNCKWVVVSNFIEIRFYHQSNQGEYQSYKISDLQNDDYLREFLFLFHKDRLTNSDKSVTDKLYELRERFTERVQNNKHIIDQLYDSINKFEGLGFVDPNFLCNLYPFNVSEDYVWHYKKGRMLTLNTDITDFLKGITTSEDGISLSKEVHGTIKKLKVIEAQQKIEYIFKKLSEFRIEQICAPLDLKTLQKKEINSIGYSLRHFEHIHDTELVIVSTFFGTKQKCECINCTFRKFELSKFITELKQNEQYQRTDTLDLAYGHYLVATDYFKKSYFLYKNVDINTKGREDKKIHYFLSKINQLYLFNLVATGTKEPQEKEILRDIKSIDLDRSIHDELEVYVDNDVRKYLIEIKENKLFIKTKEYIYETLEKLEKSKADYYDVDELLRKYLILYSHINKNRIIYDVFSDFQKISEKVFRSLILAYTSKNQLISEIPTFYFTEAILYISTQNLETILKPLDRLFLSEETKTNLIEQTKNLMTSYSREGILGYSIKDENISAQLENLWFKNRFLRIFSNLFSILSKAELSSSFVKDLANPIIIFLKAEDFLGFDNIKIMGKFIEKHGSIFNSTQLHDLLIQAINGTKYGYIKYEDFIKSICYAYRENYLHQPINDKSLIPKAIANSMNQNGESDPRPFIYLYAIIEDVSKKMLIQEMDKYLIRNFDDFAFIEMLNLKIITLQDKKYLELYIDSTIKSKGINSVKIVDGELNVTNTTMINFIHQIYKYNIQLNKDQLNKFTNLDHFETWALNISEFDYTHFETDWLIAVNDEYILTKLVIIPEIHKALEERLSKNYNSTLSKIYFKYFIGKLLRQY
ncbi:hypothetical protein [Sphingobacterium cellulitidis]|uniref:Type I restriction enzyme R protein N-terminal domain-containing protein n=1 Tax=Sphingobacterium cellulitidis TaxID=1768011 RepID=A0A8H9KV44_9SPHI|nr:hypothetical protein [Sphingobacterium soli]MBA8986930.1 hypothetical protein [Sphingobacterium soli]GGE14996.1 hypothetical protein GCM10011516_10990 [Sphingobacterium soli]